MMTPRQELEVVVDTEHADEILKHRQRLRKPMTDYAAKLLARKLALCPDPNAAAELMIEKGWQSIEPGWIANVSGLALPKPTTTPSTIAAKVLQAMQDADSRQGQQGQLGFTL